MGRRVTYLSPVQEQLQRTSGSRKGSQYKDSGFNCLVKDCVKDLKRFGKCICFTQEQVAAIKEKTLKGVTVREDEFNFFHITVK